MNFSSLLLLCLLGVSAFQLVRSTADSGESHQQKERRNKCGGLVTEPPTSPPPPSTAAPSTTVSVAASTGTVPTPAPGECVCTPASPTDSSEVSGAPGSGEEGNFHSHCILIEAFYNFSLTLTIQQQVLWEAWIVEIENTILVRVDLTEDEKVVLISLSLKHFFELNVDISIVLGYKEIADWGTCHDFIYVAISIQIEITQSIVTIGGNGGCELTEGLKNASKSEECGCSQQDQDDIASLIVEIEAILVDVSYTYEQQLAVVWELFEAFFESHASLKSYVLSIHIEGYGSVESFLQVCHTYKLVTTLSLSISGSSSADCALLAALEEASTNSSFTPSQQLQIVQLLQKFQAFFEVNVDLKVRLEYISAQCYQMFKMEDFIVSIIEQVSLELWGGDIYDLIFCSGICTNHGCGNPNDGPGPQVESTTSSSSSSSSSTSTQSTTTTPAAADCNKCGDLITIDASNQTVLTSVLLTNYNTWTLSKKAGFNSCFNQIRKAIWDHVNFPTIPSKLASCRAAFNGYSTNNVAVQDEVFNIVITSWQGTIRQFVACP